MSNNIIINKEVSSGSPTIKGRRLTVFNVVTKIFYEEDLLCALQDYDMPIEVAKEAVSYCSNLVCQSEPNLVSFCSGCILRTLQEGWNFNYEDYKSLEIGRDEVTISKDENKIFIGSIKELEDAEFGLVGWLIAKTIQERYKELEEE